jgi:predicted DNA-binding protein YlxM (UPF0122 family)
MEQVTSLKEMHDKLNEEKKQLRVKIRECKDNMQKWEKDLKYYEGAEDSVDIMLKMICENAINHIPTEQITQNGQQEEQQVPKPTPKPTPSRSRSTSSRGKK